jgi:hypothetical protein
MSVGVIKQTSCCTRRVFICHGDKQNIRGRTLLKSGAGSTVHGGEKARADTRRVVFWQCEG